MNLSQLRRFLPKIAFEARDEDLGECWAWTASKWRRGYGYFAMTWRPTRNRSAHCVSYEHFIGPVPDGMELDHLCRNPACVNPRHLEPVTHQTNVRRGAISKASSYHKPPSPELLARKRLNLQLARAKRTPDSFARAGLAHRGPRKRREAA